MAGRRPRYEGIAAGLNVVSQGIAGQYEHQQKMEDERRAFDDKLRLLGIQQRYQTERAVALQQERQQGQQAMEQMRQQGQLQRALVSPQQQLYRERMGLAGQLAPLPPEGFAPSEVGTPQANLLLQNRVKAMQQVGAIPSQGGTLRVVPSGAGRTALQTTPRSPTPVDPGLQANRIASLASKIQQIEQNNQLGQLEAQTQQRKAYPEGSIFGGYADKPQWWQLGVQTRPPLQTMPTQDTRMLRSQLQRLTGQGMAEQGQASSLEGQTTDLRQQAIQELQAVGAPVTEANIQEAMRQLSQGR